MQRLMFAMGMGVLGVVASSVLFWYIAGSWSSFSNRWLALACVLPILAFLGGIGLSEKLTTGSSDWYIPSRPMRWGYALLAGVFSSLGGYLAFVITARTWFADQIAPDASGFFYQVFHPAALPHFFERGRTGTSLEQHWWMMAGVGLVVGVWASYSSMGRRWNEPK